LRQTSANQRIENMSLALVPDCARPMLRPQLLFRSGKAMHPIGKAMLPRRIARRNL
jgi:hypothetical protein